MLNRVILIGRLTRDPELRKTISGMSVVSFSIAVDDPRKNPDGTKNTLFMNCSMFGQRAENVAKYTHKGSLVAVEGRLNQRKYVRRSDNVEITVVETVCDNVEFLEPKSATGNVLDSGYQPDEEPSATVAQTPAPESSPNLDTIDVVDDDLPF